MLLGRDDVDSDKPGMLGQTPLCRPVERGCEGVVKILLGRDDVNAEPPAGSGQTPLRCVAHDGREGAVKILLGWDDSDNLAYRGGRANGWGGGERTNERSKNRAH